MERCVLFESDASDESEQGGLLRSIEIISGAQSRLPAELRHSVGCTSNVYRSEIRDSFVAQESSGIEDHGTSSSDAGAISYTTTGQRHCSSSAERAPHVRSSPAYSVGVRNAICTEDTLRTAEERRVQTAVENHATSHVNDDTRYNAEVTGIGLRECLATTPGSRDSRVQQFSPAPSVSRDVFQDNRSSLQEMAYWPNSAVVGETLPAACNLDLNTQNEVHATAAAVATDFNIAVDTSTPSICNTQALRTSSCEIGSSYASSSASQEGQLSSLMNANKYQANMILQLRSKIKEQEQIIAELTQNGVGTSTWLTVEEDVHALQLQCDAYREDFENERYAKERALNEKKSLEQQVTMLLFELRSARDKMADLEKKLKENEQKQSTVPAADDDRADWERIYSQSIDGER